MTKVLLVDPMGRLAFYVLQNVLHGKIGIEQKEDVQMIACAIDGHDSTAQVFLELHPDMQVQLLLKLGLYERIAELRPEYGVDPDTGERV
jgi:hypothetical protein